MVSILTPTYNREYIIETLYNSLKHQSDKNFEWIVIDDGSTDKTEKLFNRIVKENFIKIKYFKKYNGGKHTALNYGINYCNGEITIIVDSDDYLEIDAVKKIRQRSEGVLNRINIAGVSFRKKSIKTNKVIGARLEVGTIEATFLEYRYNYKITGDLAECYKTDILKKYKFPIFDDEKFVPEALIWNRISKKYKMIFYNDAIYCCEYLSDGYSQRFNELRKENLKAYKLFYKEELLHRQIPLKRKIKSLLRFCQIMYYEKRRIN